MHNDTSNRKQFMRTPNHQNYTPKLEWFTFNGVFFGTPSRHVMITNNGQ